MSDVYNSSTAGPIPLNFEGRRLMANLRDAIQDAIKAGNFLYNNGALSRARAAIAKELSWLQEVAKKGKAYRDEASRLASLAGDLERDLDDARRLNAALRFDLDDAQRRATGQITITPNLAATKRIAELEAQLDAALRQNTQVANQYEEARRAAWVLRNERDAARDVARDAVHDRVKQTEEGATQRITELEAQLDAACQRATALRTVNASADQRIAELEAQLSAAKSRPTEPRYAVFVVCDPWDSEIRVVKKLTASGARAAQAHPAHGRTICIPESVLADLEYLPGGKVRNHKPNWDAIRKAAVSP